jgi:hypothetical protein
MQPRAFDPLECPLISQYVDFLTLFFCIVQLCIFNEMYNGVDIAFAAKFQKGMPESLLRICSQIRFLRCRW